MVRASQTRKRRTLAQRFPPRSGFLGLELLPRLRGQAAGGNKGLKSTLRKGRRRFKTGLIVTFALLLSSCSPKQPPNPEPTDTLVLKNGGKIQGKILVEKPDRVLIRWSEGAVEFLRSEIAEIRRGEKLIQDKTDIQLPEFQKEDLEEGQGPYPRVYLKNGQVVSGAALRKEDKIFYLKQPLEGGGAIEHGFQIERIEKIALWPPPTSADKNKDFQKIKKGFPRFSPHKKPPYEVISDSESSDLVQYLKALQQFYQGFLMYFFDWINKDLAPPTFPVVIFADYEQFRQYGGIPPNSDIVGFYLPENRILFLFNAKEMDMMKLYFFGSASFEADVDNVLDPYLQNPNLDPAEKLRIQGLKESVKDVLERDRSHREYKAREFTMGIIRHEGGHQLLHHFGIDVDRDHAYRGAWFSEGLACYLEPEEMGAVNPMRLMDIRYELEKGHHLMPLQYLLTFRSGAGIHKLLDSSYALLGYAESWAFVYFLMEETHRDSFTAYIRDLMKQDKGFDGEKDRALLEKHLGRSLKEIEPEFNAFLDRMLQEEIDPENFEEYRLHRLVSE